MKIRVPFPEGMLYNAAALSRFIDDVLLWGMEIDIQLEHYTTAVNTETVGFAGSGRPYQRVLSHEVVFIIEEKDAFLFALRWGAKIGKKKKVEIC